MWILEPFLLPATAVTASNIAEDDAPAWAAGTFNKGDVVMHRHYVWACLADSVTSEPSTTAATDWFKRGPVNRFRPFDQGNDTQAERADQITFTVVPGRRLNRVWLLGLNAVAVRLEIVAGGQTVYDKTQSALRPENRNTFYSWFFADKEYRSKIAFTDIPTFADVANAELRITVDRPGGIAKVGEILFGQNWTVGETLFQTAPRILNYSRDERDEFGNAVLTRRRASREIRYQVAVNPKGLDYLLDRFEGMTAGSGLTGTKLLFSAGDNLENYGTTVFGTLASISTPIEGPNITTIEIQARGFIA